MSDCWNITPSDTKKLLDGLLIKNEEIKLSDIAKLVGCSDSTIKDFYNNFTVPQSDLFYRLVLLSIVGPKEYSLMSRTEISRECKALQQKASGQYPFIDLKIAAENIMHLISDISKFDSFVLALEYSHPEALYEERGRVQKTYSFDEYNADGVNEIILKYRKEFNEGAKADLEKWGADFRNSIKRNGMNIEKVAFALGCSIPTITRIAEGVTWPSECFCLACSIAMARIGRCGYEEYIRENNLSSADPNVLNSEVFDRECERSRIVYREDLDNYYSGR